MLITLTDLQDQPMYINYRAILSFNFYATGKTLLILDRGVKQYVKEAPDILAAQVETAERDDELRHYTMLKSFERLRRQYEPGREEWVPENA
jgi:hypothetical protein